MNWSEFFRTLTWLFAILFVFAALGGVLFGWAMASDPHSNANDKRSGHRLVIAGIVFIILAVVLFSIIGGMGWGLTPFPQ